MSDYLYLIGASKGGPIKIGVSRAPRGRLTNLQTGNPQKLRVFETIACAYGLAFEAVIHQLLGDHRLNGEWFDVSVEDALCAVELALSTPIISPKRVIAPPGQCEYCDRRRAATADAVARHRKAKEGKTC